MNMKRILTIVLIGIACPSLAQEDGEIINQQASVSMVPMFQQWTSGGVTLFSEVSSTLTWYQPLTREASVSLRTSYAAASGNVTSLQSLNDVQLNLNYYFEPADMVFGLGLNLPSGKKKLTQGEFETSYLISNSLFRLQVPHYGTGFNISPTVSWAVPVSDRVVVGVGAMYFYRGSFDPVIALTNYDPADEITLSAGCDVRLDPVSTVSFDAVFTIFGKDKVNNVEVFAPGRKLLGGVRFKRYLGFDELSFSAVARFRSNTEVRIGNVLLPNQERVEPNQLELGGFYAAKLTNIFVLRFLLEGRFFEESSDPLSGAVLGMVGVGPEFSVSGSIKIPVLLKYTFGNVKGNTSVSGLDAGVGITFTY